MVLQPARGLVVPEHTEACVDQEGPMVVDLWRSVDRLGVVVPRGCHEPAAGCEYSRDLAEGVSFVRCKQKGVDAHHPT
jgi:hypothetical protein